MDKIIAKSRHSAGGVAWGKIQRKRSLRRYYFNPNICLQCNKIIEVPDSKRVADVIDRKFCSKSCAAKLNNVLFQKRIAAPKAIKEKKGRPERKMLVKIPMEKPESTMLTKAKKEFYLSKKNWQSARSSIAKNARLVFTKSSKNRLCANCGYDKHFEVCHIKDVASFSDEALIGEINHIDNLIGLCPTCHWEFDNGHLTF